VVDPAISETRYARSGDVSIAYQVVGEGPLDLVYVMGWVSHLDLFWEEPTCARFLHRLSSFSRLILFDKRGTGLSDRVPTDALPTLEQRMDDVRAVMDAVGCNRAALLGVSEGGPMCALFAATYPSRTSALVMYGSYAKRVWAADYPWAPTPAERQQFFDLIQQGWGGVVDAETLAPSMVGKPHFGAWWAAYLRASASPAAALALARMNTEIDIRQVLPTVRVPTLILHRTGDLDIDVGGSRWMARTVPGARYVELSGHDHLPWVGDSDAIVDEVQEFLTGVRGDADVDRVLATVMITDIVGSTEHASRLGDRSWRDLLNGYDRLVVNHLERFRGRYVNTTGDGTLATFDGPARAIECARAISHAVESIGIEVRAGLHTGEVESRGQNVAGLAVHIAARVASLAGGSEVLVTRTVTDLVAGSGISFDDRGEHELKGLPGTWRLFAVGG
jgi:class 3 adenylate cyclase